MVSAMMGETLKPVLRDISEVRARIIGIDGNGTGREGVLQRQNKSIERLDEGQKFIIDQLHNLTNRSETWSKAGFWKGLRWMLATLIALLAVLMSYLGYRASQHPAEPLAKHAFYDNAPLDASQDMR